MLLTYISYLDLSGSYLHHSVLLDCKTGTFGAGCSNKCSCHPQNAKDLKTCDAVTGQCKCKRGWIGRNCSERTLDIFGYLTRCIISNCLLKINYSW